MTPDPFRSVHTARRWKRVALAASALAVGAVATAVWVVAAASSPIKLPVDAVAIAAPQVEVLPLPSPVTEAPPPATHTAQPIAPPARPSPQELADTASATYTIQITATGYQAELDQCQWVRMDLGAAAPIVGAHNDCGGGIALEMTAGQTVALTGAGLDGTYVVLGAREAHAGDSAAGATAGMTADVVLQTCFWGGGGKVRLVELLRL